ncbi:hypothetical protein N0V90_008975 [Kalmusia sp. IMI 367209]|nr:hypothetical protein N0V90_008975 [Kalmusia sp. IMI 367209]
MTTTPIEPLPVATVSLGQPFPPKIVFYEDAKTTAAAPGDHKLWYNSEGNELKDLKEPKDWSTVLLQTPVTITKIGPEANGIVTSAIFSWRDDRNRLAYWELVSAQTVLPSTEVEVTAKPTNATSSKAPDSTTSSTRGNSDKPPASETSMVTSPASSLPATPPTASATPPIVSKSNGLSGGAVAGVAIGCLLAGALVAGLIAWFCLKRRKPTSGVRDSEASTIALMHREKGAMAKTVSVTSGSPITSALENGLPQPLEDKAISGEISKISNLIKNHVQSYYHTRAVSAGMIDFDDLHALGENLPVSVETLSTLLKNSATREIALRFCLARVVTSCIQLKSSPKTSFLPPEVSQSIQSMAHADRSFRVHALFFTKWRALTAELLQSAYVHNAFSAGDGRLHNVQVAAMTLDSVLRPFADSRMDDGARSRNLEEILKRSAQFAFTLFSQPTTWDFDWHSEEGVKSGSLCIFPALVQVADENGEPINPPRPFSEAVNRRLDE